jgi:cell division protein FtsB
MSVWHKLGRVVMVLLGFTVFALFLLAVFFSYLPLIQQNQRLRAQLFDIEAKIAQETKLNRQLRASIDAVQSDPRTIERLAREKLGWARSNETVIRFESPRR